MPKIAVDAQERKRQFKILKGKAEVVLFTHRSTWHYRQYIPKERRYVTRSLETTDLEQAREDAIELFYVLQKELDESGVPAKSEVLIKDLLKHWVRENEDKQRTGQITSTTLRAKTGSLEGPISIYLLKQLGLKTIGQIKKDTFLGYRTWRITEGWKYTNSPWGKVVPKDSTVKRDLTHVKDWFANFLIPKGYTTIVPTIEKIVIRQDQLDANPPIPLEPDWRIIYTYLRRWVNDGVEHPNPRVRYWRECFRHFVLISYQSGTRPKELVGEIEKIRTVDADGKSAVEQKIRCGLQWQDVEVDMATHVNEESGKEFEYPEATLYIRESKTGLPRQVPCNAGKFFIRWRQFCNEYRHDEGLPPLKKTDYVFFNPYTNRPYSYTHFSRTWDDMREVLKDKLSTIRSNRKYTIYSLRSSYITNQIEEGMDVYLIKKLTGHSLELLHRHYDRSDVLTRRAEATARTYSKTERRPSAVDLENLASANIGKSSASIDGADDA